MSDIYQDVTNRILEQLKAGVIPWRNTWTTGLPKSLTTGKEYRGINVLILAGAPYQSRYWITYRDAQRRGGQVRKGEKATRVYFWHWRTPEELAEMRAKRPGCDPAPCTCFSSAVFNVEQVDGVTPPPDDDLTRNTQSPIERADAVVAVMPNPPRIIHSTTVAPCYLRNIDEVLLPHLSQFETTAEYYATLFHELVHATASRSRLNRKPEPGLSAEDRYAFDELIAEFGASFLMALAGLANPTSNELASSYIDDWSKLLQKDTRVLVRAASAAQRAADYIRGKVVTEGSPSADTEQPTPSNGLAA